MFIIKFNNMVKNKWIWGAFAVLVAVAFAGSDILGGGYGSDRDRDGGPGRLNGKPVDDALFNEAARSFEIEAALGLTRFSGYDAHDVWKRYAAYCKARELGIDMPDADVASAIVNSVRFTDRDGFHKEAYEAMLGMLRLNERQFERALHFRMTLDRLRSFVSGRVAASDPLIPAPLPAISPYVPASVVEERAQGWTASYVLSYATLSNAHSKATVTLSDDEARDFWARRTNDLYRVPDRRTVAYVAFPAAGRDLPADRLEQACREYFLDHEEEYDAGRTNAPAAPVEGFDEELFAEVRDRVEKAVRPALARSLACRAARDFSRLFNPDYLREGEPIPDFFATAAAQGFGVVTSAPFAADQPPAPFDAEFAEETFGLSAPGEVTGLIGDPDAASVFYVATLLSTEPAHVTPFEEVSEDAADRAAEQKAEEAFGADVERVQKEFVLGLENGVPFAEIASSNQLEAVLDVSFSWKDRTANPAPLPSPQQVASAMVRLGPGDFSKQPVSTPDGVLFFQVQDRTPGEGPDLEQQRMQQNLVYGAEYEDLLWNEWMNANLASMNPEPRTPFGGSDAPAEDED